MMRKHYVAKEIYPSMERLEYNLLGVEIEQKLFFKKKINLR